MTAKEFPLFFGALGKLAVMYRVKMDKATARAYFEALQHVPIAVLMPAMQHLLAHGGDFMPTASRILETVDGQSEERETQEAISAVAGRLSLDGQTDGTAPHGFFCAICEDTGRRTICPGCANPETCDKQKNRYCPDFKDGAYTLPVIACECVTNNPELLRKRKSERHRGPRYSKPIRRERNFYGREDD